MQKTMRTLFMMAIAAMTASSILFSEFRGTQTTQASSHREAPLITMDQNVDNTDVYMFRSPDLPNTVTVIANFIPLEEPSIGPNFYKFDDNALYQLRFDNNGDARLDLAIEFRFRTVVGNGNTFLYNTNTIDNLSDPDWNVKQFMSVTARIRQGDPNVPTFTTFNLTPNMPSGQAGFPFFTPPVNIGPRSTPTYETNLAEASIGTVPLGSMGDVKVFAGQRDEGFYIDTGSGFDLLGLRPFNSAHLAPLPNSNGVDSLAGYNVHSIAIQVPIQLLTASGMLPSGPTDPNAIVGVYSTASRPSTRVLNTDGTATFTGNCAAGQGLPGADASCVQVSRLANPLVNELFIPQGSSISVSENDKDLYNAQLPIADGQVQPQTQPAGVALSRGDYVRGTATRPVERVGVA